VELKDILQIAELYKSRIKNATDIYYDYLDQHFEYIIKEYCSKLNQPARIEWTQHTPSFNDGDPCLFSLYCSVFEEGESYPQSDLSKEIERFVEKNSDYLEYKYGDGWKITVTEDGIEVEEYCDW